MEKQRVNKVTAIFNNEDGVTMTLYRTHTKLAQLSNNDINVPPFSESNATNKATYMIYCKETLITLLQNDGVEGYYYEEKSEEPQSSIPKKFTEPLFIQWAKNIVDELIAKMNIGVPVETSTVNIMPEITERYKNGNIKYGTMKVNATIDSIKFSIPVSIKSGQLSKPKKIDVDGEEKGFNVTTLKALMKTGGITPQKEDKQEIQEKPQEEIQEKPQGEPQEAIKEPEGTNTPTDITELKEDVKELKEDVSEVKEEIKEVKEDVSKVEKDIRGIKRDKKVNGIVSGRATSASISKLMRAMKEADNPTDTQQ